MSQSGREKIIKLNIQSYYDREKIIIALTNSGYKVWVEEKSIGEFPNLPETKYMVCIDRQASK